MSETDGDVGKWSDDLPTCDQILCPEEIAAPENGVRSCSNGRVLGSVCRLVKADLADKWFLKFNF